MPKPELCHRISFLDGRMHACIGLPKPNKSIYYLTI